MGWWAYVDESMRQRHDKTGLYVLAAAVFDQVDADTVRSVIRTLAHGRRRFHWKNEEAKDRRKAASTVSDLDSLHLIVVGTGLDNTRQERGRRACLERLLWELSESGVARVWLDARRPVQNRRDLDLVDRLRTRGVLGDAIQVDFASAAEEPLTWIPDIVAGAVSAAWGEGELQYFVALEGVISGVVEIDLT